jgi:hypothetical protein
MLEERPTERRLNVRLDPVIHRRLRMQAAERDISIQRLVEELLTDKFGPTSPHGASPLVDEGPKYSKHVNDLLAKE